MPNPSKICDQHRGAAARDAEMAEQHEAGNADRAAHQAHMAHGHMCHASDHSAQATKQHAAQHGPLADVAWSS